MGLIGLGAGLQMRGRSRRRAVAAPDALAATAARAYAPGGEGE